MLCLAVGLIALTLWRQREPDLLGHPVSYWVLGWRHAHTETPDSVAAAHAAMDASHVRWLRRQLDWRPSLLRELIASFLYRLGFSVSSQSSDDYREQAATALGRLGDRAREAIDDLEAMSKTTIEPRSFQAKAAARAALVLLGEESSERIVSQARNPTSVDWYSAADILARLPTHRKEALEIFADIMHSTNATGVRCRSIQLYRVCQPPVAEAVSNLCRTLDDRAMRVNSLAQLGMLGPAAGAATQKVAQIFADPDPHIRWFATNALRRLTGPTPGPTPGLAPASGVR